MPMGLADRLRKSRRALTDGLSRILGGGSLDDEDLERAEEVLLESDLGWELTEQVLDRLPGQVRRSGGDWREALVEVLSECVPLREPARLPEGVRPHVIMVVGVNGAGKTTTIAKLARGRMQRGQRVLLACADTFRAAAAEQLGVWAERLGAAIITQEPGADPGAVAFDAVTRGVSRDYDAVIIDTAGRLPNKKGLMAELGKVYRVCGKAMEGAPHSVLLVLDGTVGQNAGPQAGSFRETLPVTGLVVTKLDGTARGGAVLAMASGMDIPIEYVGVGERMEDLVPFDRDEYVRALVEDPGGV